MCDLRVSAVILHAPSASEMPMAAVVATSYAEILVSVDILYDDGVYHLDYKHRRRRLMCSGVRIVGHLRFTLYVTIL